jgi:transcriptional regulator with XRE-family HTH domain
MSDPNTLGSLVRKRRLESGYSLGQLAAKVGKTAAEVRAWERDSELPEHGIIDRLASTLEIDLDDIKQRLEAGKKALEAERRAADAADAAAESDASIESEDAAAEPVAEQPEAEPVVVAEPEDEDDLPGFAVTDPHTPPAVEGRAEDVGPAADADLLDAPTEAVPVPVITGTATAARASRAAAVLEEPPPPPATHGSATSQEEGLLRYLEPLRVLFDPHNRYLYWIRAGLTAVVLVVFAVILMAQLGNLLDAIGELLDTIEPAARNPDQLEPIGLIWFYP